MVDNGEVYWIEVMGQDRSGNPGTPASCRRWHEDFPAEKVVCLADENYDFTTWMGVSGFPWAMMAGPDMVITVFDRRNNNLAPLDEVQAMAE